MGAETVMGQVRNFKLKVETPKVKKLYEKYQQERTKKRREDWSDLSLIRDVLDPFTQAIIDGHLALRDSAEALKDKTVNSIEAHAFRHVNRIELYDNDPGAIIPMTASILHSALANRIHEQTGNETSLIEFDRNANGTYVFTARIGAVSFYYGLDLDRKIHVNAGNNIDLQESLLAEVNRRAETGKFDDKLEFQFSILAIKFRQMEQNLLNNQISHATINFGDKTPYASFDIVTRDKTTNVMKTREMLKYQIVPQK